MSGPLHPDSELTSTHSWKLVARPELVLELTEEMDMAMRSGGCDPHCHFCMKSLKLGDKFGFKRLAVGTKGSACEECIKSDRPAPVAEVLKAAEHLRAVKKSSSPSGASAPPPVRREVSYGFITFSLNAPEWFK